MEFDNTFEVPLPPERAWPVLFDVSRIVNCMPGAELTEIVDSSTFKGKVTVRLGPVTLGFAGTVNFTEIDATNYKATANARGNDAKGRGGATAAVRFQLDSSPAGSRVTVHTTLTLTGSVAQYGRATGVVKELAGQLTSEFAQRLRAQIEAESTSAKSELQLERDAEHPARNLETTNSLSATRLIWKTILAYLRRFFAPKAQ